MNKAKKLENLYLRDGSELICFYDNGTHIVKEFADAKDELGLELYRGSYSDCRQFMNFMWVSMAKN